MTKKHFEAIARIFACHPAINSAEIKTLGYNMADWLGTQNPNFDRSRFLKAAGIYDPNSGLTEDWQEDAAFEATTGVSK